MLDRYLIFASVGNATQPFDRFLRIVDEAAGRTGLRTLIQTGSGKFRPIDVIGVGRSAYALGNHP